MGNGQAGKSCKNIFLTGAPSSGKTTVIKKIVAGLGTKARGFITEEERKDGRRTGFVLRTLDGKEGYLAHENIQSEHAIRRFGVSIENVESIAVPSIEPSGGEIIILDEIGKMECFSPLFREAALRALDSESRVIGTIPLGGGGFIESIKTRVDMEIIEVTPQNRDGLPENILSRLG
jgi:nucleoside-triphosphatase